MDFRGILAGVARQVLEHGQGLVKLPDFLKGAPEAVAAVKSLQPLIASVTGFADPPTKEGLDAFEAEVFAGLDDTIDRLGDDPG